MDMQKLNSIAAFDCAIREATSKTQRQDIRRIKLDFLIEQGMTDSTAQLRKLIDWVESL